LNTAAQYIVNQNEASQDEKCSAQFLKATVQPDGSFVIQTASGSKRSYAARKKQ
jgi:hypothetical protein